MSNYTDLTTTLTYTMTDNTETGETRLLATDLSADEQDDAQTHGLDPDDYSPQILRTPQTVGSDLSTTLTHVIALMHPRDQLTLICTITPPPPRVAASRTTILTSVLDYRCLHPARTSHEQAHFVSAEQFAQVYDDDDRIHFLDPDDLTDAAITTQALTTTCTTTLTHLLALMHPHERLTISIAVSPATSAPETHEGIPIGWNLSSRNTQ